MNDPGRKAGNVHGPDKEPRNPLFDSEHEKARAEVSRMANLRVEAYQRAQTLAPFVVRARTELQAQFEEKGYTKAVGDNAIAEWLNANAKEHRGKNGGNWGRTSIRTSLMQVPQRIIELAVLECRTRMTSIALSADFTKPLEAVAELEREYLGYIADALELGHRLNGNRARSREELIAEARHEAIRLAAIQRANKPMSMLARERLWKHLPPVARKVFDGKS